MSTATADPPAADRPMHPAALAAWAVGGPALMGLAFTLTFTPGRGIDGPPMGFVLAWPAAILGVTLLCAPTLYIAAAFAGVAPDPQRTARAFATNLGAIGRLLVGVLPATAFLAATNPGVAVIALCGLVLLLGALVFLRGLYHRVFADDARPRTRVLFAGWSVLFLAVCVYVWSHVFV